MIRGMKHWLIAAWLGWSTSVALAAPPTKVTVQAGDVDRASSIVTFEVDETTPLQLKPAGGGPPIPVQVHAGRGWFVLPALKRGARAEFDVEGAPPGVAGTADHVVSMTTAAGGAMQFSAAGKPILTYQSEKVPVPEGFEPQYLRGGYISEVTTPGGRMVTDDYPPKHKHHHGVFFAWTNAEFEGRHVDFWNMGQKLGRVEPLGVDDSFSGVVCGGVRARHRYVDMTAKPQEKTALNEVWDVVVYRPLTTSAGRAYHVFDVTVTQTAGAEPLALPKYHYGGLAVRGNRGWDELGNPAKFLTSEGKTRKDADEQPAKWAMIYGNVGGQPAGIAVLGHPSNFRAPQPVRVHPKEPYLCFNPQWLGEFKIEEGKPYVSRYRLVVADGPMEAGELDRLWGDYAEPAKVIVK